MNRSRMKLVDQYDSDGNGWLDATERKGARAAATAKARNGHGPTGGPPHGNRPAADEGTSVSPTDVATFPDVSLYDSFVLRTIFLTFEGEDWEQELADFRHTDVEVPATLAVDGKQHPLVGVRFRGNSSYFGVPAGYKRSFNISVDMADSKQRVLGYKTLNLLNSHEDPSFLHTVLALRLAREHGVPAPQANLVKVVINGKNWGIYVNVQQINKQLLSELFPSPKGRAMEGTRKPRRASWLDLHG